MKVCDPKQENVVTAKASERGIRLDVFLSQKMAGLSRAQLTKLIKAGQVTSGGRVLRPRHTVAANEEFTVRIPAVQTSALTPQNIPLDIIYSDAHIAVVNKARGMVVHPGAGVYDNTLVNALLYHFKGLAIGDEERPGIVHRLDKETSGLIVIAKTHMAHQELIEAFKTRRVIKNYRAFAWGSFEFQKFDLQTGHMRHPHNRLRFFTGIDAPKIPLRGVRRAHTSFSVVRQRFGIAEIVATLHTGRTHQIRAHLADIGHPLLGDHLYGGMRCLARDVPQKLRETIACLHGQALHAESLSFDHPIEKRSLTFHAPLPDSMAQIQMFMDEES